MSDREDISNLFHTQKVAPIPRILDEARPDPALLDDDTMMTLLKDVYSVDTRFMQGWAEFSPLTLTADKVSLPTFCALVMYIYTGKIERMVDPSKFAISTRHTLPAVLDTAKRGKDTCRWQRQDSGLPWSLGSIPWINLLIAADVYHIEALHAYCGGKVIEAINENSVVETKTLFRVGGHSLEVKTAAIDFIAKNMKTLLADIKDPFSGFAKDKNCHDMMVEVMRTWDAVVPRSKVMKEGQNHFLGFYLSSEAPVAAPGKSLTAVPSMADFVMERLYADEASQDILFVIGEEPVDADSESEVSEGEDTHQQALSKVADETLRRASRRKMTRRVRTTKWTLRTRRIRTIKKGSKNKEDSDDKETSDDVSNGDAKTAEKGSRAKSKDAKGEGSVDGEDKKGDEEEGKKEEEMEDPIPERIVGAHKMVLSHWPYFKKMIDAKGGDPGKTRIYVRDVDWAAFRVLIRFLYTGRLPPSLEPTIVFADGSTKDGETSWEDLFSIADHCEVDELRQISLTTILSKLTPEGAIPFLFRMAHLHKDLRTPVVKYVATTCGAEISKKSVQQEYADHDDCLELFDGSIDRSQWTKEGEKYGLSFGFYSDNPVTPPAKPTALAPTLACPTLANLMMERLYEDEASQDVVFVFGEGFGDSESEVDVPENEEAHRESPINIHSNGSKSESEVENVQQSESRETSEDKEHPDNIGVSEDEKSSGGNAALDEIPNPGDAESTGESKDKPKDGQVGNKRPNDDQGSDDDEGHEEGEDDTMTLMKTKTRRWEKVFLAADHCEVDELRQVSLTTILSKLTPEGTIPFLFRTAYLHKDLRASVIEYVATTCGAEISKKSVQQEYADHDECVAIFGEIITELHTHIESLE
ncbi:hypothetical protein CPB97_008532 [Podila verticillata]|nr:hypothetical protein CPB97_008532 [Podila verticillata]